MSEDRIQKIEEALRAAFSPTELRVKDQSHLHAGHAGARDGMGHFDVMIVAEAFAGRNPLERHRMIYQALGSLMQTDIHALRIRATTPEKD